MLFIWSTNRDMASINKIKTLWNYPAGTKLTNFIIYFITWRKLNVLFHEDPHNRSACLMHYLRNSWPSYAKQMSYSSVFNWCSQAPQTNSHSPLHKQWSMHDCCFCPILVLSSCKCREKFLCTSWNFIATLDEWTSSWQQCSTTHQIWK